jgi:hypothetical protein
VPNEHGKYLIKFLPYRVEAPFDVIPNELNAWCNRNLGPPALVRRIGPKKEPAIHRNPLGNWVFYKRHMYFRDRKIAMQLKLSGMCDGLPGR